MTIQRLLTLALMAGLLIVSALAIAMWIEASERPVTQLGPAR